MAPGLDLPVPKNVGAEIERVLIIFRELRSGATADGKVTLKTPSGSLSTAEAIAVTIGGLSQAAWFDNGKLSPEGIAPNLLGAIVKDPVSDQVVSSNARRAAVTARSMSASPASHAVPRLEPSVGLMLSY